VRERLYFRLPIEDEAWHARRFAHHRYMLDRLPSRYCMEAIYSKTTGELEVAFSRALIEEGEPGGEPERLPGDKARVAVLLTKLYSLVDAQLPPDCGYTVIAEDGRILIDSDKTRILRENLFEETEDPEPLHAMAQTDAEGHLTIDHKLTRQETYVAPLSGTPWTLIVSGGRESVHVTLVESLSLSLLLFIAYVIVLGILIALLANSRKRVQTLDETAWYWPDPAKRRTYIQLSLSLAVLVIGWVVLIFSGSPERAAMFALVGIALSLSMVYYQLRRPAGTPELPKPSSLFVLLLLLFYATVLFQLYYSSAFSPWTVLVLLALFLIAFSGALDRFYLLTLFLPCFLAGWWLIIMHDWVDVTVGFLTTVALALIGYRSAWRERLIDVLQEVTDNASGPRARVTKSYCVCLLMLLICCAALPPMAFFNLARSECEEALVANSQMQFTQAFRARIARLRDSLPHLPERRWQGLVSLPPFETDEATDEATGEDTDEATDEAAEDTTDSEGSRPFGRGGLYSGGEMKQTDAVDNKRTIRQLLVGRVSGNLPGFFPLTHMVRALAKRSEDRARYPWYRTGDHLVYDWNLENETLAGDAYLLTPLTHRKTPRLLIYLLVFGIVLWLLIRSAVRHVFVTDLEPPVLMDSTGMGERYRMILRRAPEEPLEDAVIISQGHLTGFDPERQRIGELVAMEQGQNRVVFTDMHASLADRVTAERLIELLEYLIEKEIPVDIYSDVEPLYALTVKSHDVFRGDSAYHPNLLRWAALLEYFTKEREETGPGVIEARRKSYLTNLRHLRHEGSGELARWIAIECAGDRYLESLGKKLFVRKESEKLTREEIIDQIGFLAEPYYRRVWSLCSTDEKMVIYTTAQDGFANWQHETLLRRIMRRGLMHASGDLRLMNESFRRFAITAELPETFQRWEAQVGKSLWSRMSRPLNLALALLAAFLLVTQQEIFAQTIAAVTALTAGTPAILNYLGSMIARRGASRDQAAADT